MLAKADGFKYGFSRRVDHQWCGRVGDEHVDCLVACQQSQGSWGAYIVMNF